MSFKVREDYQLESVDMGRAYKETMDRILASDPDVFTIDADLMGCTGFDELVPKYPGRVLNTGIQEANMVSMGAGLSNAGKKVFACTFASFMTRRAYDQIFVSCAYGKNSIRLFGMDAGITTAYNGGTHMPFEDMALMRAIPGAYVFDVTDAVMMSKLLPMLKDMEGVLYFRSGRGKAIGVYKEDSEFQVGKGNIIKDGRDATVIACGPLVAQALKAARDLEKEGLSIRVVDMFTVKPLDEELVIRCAKETGCIVTAENHNIYGGLGEAVAGCLCENYPAPLVRHGSMDEFGEVGSYEYLAERFKFTFQGVTEAIRKALAKKK